ncbi:MAG: hypothetical protein BroJett015_09960 [Chloroflexota bacterium]|nr:MAG: hypothetical protein BroJett015_09960 [Chloroflexota bacterium]
MPALIVDYTRQQLEAGHGGKFVEATAVYILAERTVYYFWIAYAPPPVDEYNTAKSNYLMIKSHILESFTADLE